MKLQNSARLCFSVLFVLQSATVRAWEGPKPYGDDLGYFRCLDDEIEHIGLALSDALALAKEAQTIDEGGNDANDVKAFTHYFRTDNREPSDLSMFLAAMRAAETYITPPASGSRQIPWKIECVPREEKGGCAKSDRAITEYGKDVEDPTMFICPSFFRSGDTKRHLNEHGICDNANKKTFVDFETGGHTILHELTHFDGFGRLAGMPEYLSPTRKRKNSEKPEPSCGTDDWKLLTTQRAARDLTENPDDGIDPWRNAENHAAAATEWYFQQACGVDDIPLTRTRNILQDGLVSIQVYLFPKHGANLLPARRFRHQWE